MSDPAPTPALDPEFAPPPPFDAPKAAEPNPTPAGRAFDWLRGHERGVLAVAVAFQLVVLGAMVASSALPTWGASTVLLKVVPVDPRDLMRGDYVILGYEIARLLPNGRMASQPGRTVYVALVPEADGRHYRGGTVSELPPSTGRFIRGTVDARGRVVFGIESYFVQEGKGHDYENAIRQRRLSAEVALAPDGQAALRRLVFD